MHLRSVLLLTATVCCLLAAPASASIRRLLSTDASMMSSTVASILGTNGNSNNNGPLGNMNNNNSPTFNGNAQGPNAFVSNQGVVPEPALIETSATSTVDVSTDYVRTLLRISMEVYCDGCDRALSAADSLTAATAAAVNATATPISQNRCSPTPASLQSLRSSCTSQFRGMSDSLAQYCGSSSVRHLISHGMVLLPIYDYGCDVSQAIGIEDQWSNWCSSENHHVIGYRVYELISFDAPVAQAGAIISGAIEKGAEVMQITHIASEGALVLGELRATQRATIEAALEVRAIAQLIAKLNEAATMQFHDEDEHWNYMHDCHESGDFGQDYNNDGSGNSPFDETRFQQCVDQNMNNYQSGNGNAFSTSTSAAPILASATSTSSATPVSATGNNNNNNNNANSGTCSGLQITLRSILCNPLQDGQVSVLEGIAAVAATNLGAAQSEDQNQNGDAWGSAQSVQFSTSPFVVPIQVKCILIVEIENAVERAQKNMKDQWNTGNGV